MIKCEDKSFLSSNGRTQIRLRVWLPEGEPAGTLQIAHGISSHCERYDSLARYLAEEGRLAVFANDHLGHGKSIADPSEKGFFDETDGWMKTVEDMHTVYGLTGQNFPAVPHFLLGHSMGSFLARTYLFTWPKDFDGVLLGGTGHLSRHTLLAGRALMETFAAAAPKVTPIDTETLVSRFGNPHFNVDRRATSSGGKWGFRIGLLNRFTKRPYIDKKACVRCGVCVQHCPVPDKAVNFTKGKDKPPVYDYSRCIRCYCCQEMCPQHAIHVKGI